MGIEKKDGLESRRLEDAKPGELVDGPDGEKIPKAGRDKSGRGISGLRPKPDLSRKPPINARERGVFKLKPDGSLEKVGRGAKKDLGKVLGWPDEESIAPDAEPFEMMARATPAATLEEVLSLEESVEVNLDDLTGELDDDEDDQPTRPDRPAVLPIPFGEEFQTSSIQRPTILVEVPEEVYSAPKVAIPPLDDISKFAPALEAEENSMRNLVTIPDIGALLMRSREEIARVDNLVEEHQRKKAAYSRSDGSIYVPDAELKKQREQVMDSANTVHDRTLMMLQATHHYEVAWWNSNNSLVRVWGQLNCGAQILEEAQFLADLKDVLGEGYMNEPEMGVKMPDQTDLAFVLTRQPQLRLAICNKYPQVNLDAIIARRKKK